MWLTLVAGALLVVAAVLVALMPPGTRPTWRLREQPFSRPLDLFLFRDRAPPYRADAASPVVNYWVDKGWAWDGGRIPCHVRTGFAREGLTVYTHDGQENLGSVVRELEGWDGEDDVVAWELPGFGVHTVSAAGEGAPPDRSAEGLLRCLREVLLQTAGARPVTLVGRELGCGPTLDAARWLEREGTPAARVLLLDPFASVRAVVEGVAGAGAAALCEERWDNVAAVRALRKTPVEVRADPHHAFLPRALHADRLRAAGARVTFSPTEQWGWC